MNQHAIGPRKAQARKRNNTEVVLIKVESELANGLDRGNLILVVVPANGLSGPRLMTHQETSFTITKPLEKHIPETAGLANNADGTV